MAADFVPGTASQAGPTDAQERYRTALRVWLQWNELHERLCAQLYRAGRDPHSLEEKLDTVDRLRQQAVRLTQELLQS